MLLRAGREEMLVLCVPESEVAMGCTLAGEGLELVVVEHVWLVLLESRAERTEDDTLNVLNPEFRGDVKFVNAEPVDCHELLVHPELDLSVLVVGIVVLQCVDTTKPAWIVLK